jgi:hypothetical protein
MQPSSGIHKTKGKNRTQRFEPVEWLPSHPSYTTCARCAHPTSLGWHCPGAHDCASQYQAHGGQGELRTHLGGISVFHLGAGIPPMPVYLYTVHACMRLWE